jgi:hypothetical protein
LYTVEYLKILTFFFFGDILVLQIQLQIISVPDPVADRSIYKKKIEKNFDLN